MKVNRFRFLSTVDTRLLAVLLWAFLLILPSLSMGGVQNETQAPQNRLIGYTSPTTEATYAYDALDRRIAKTVDGVTEANIYDSADLGDSTSANPALTFRAGELVKRWLFGPQTDEPLAYEAYTGTTTPGSGSVIELLATAWGRSSPPSPSPPELATGRCRRWKAGAPTMLASWPNAQYVVT